MYDIENHQSQEHGQRIEDVLIDLVVRDRGVQAG